MAPGAGLAVAPIQADEEGRTGEFLGKTAGHNAHNTLVPAFVGQNDGLRRRPLRKHGYGLPVDVGFDLLPLPVQLAQLGGVCPGPLRVLGQKQVHGHVYLPHAPGGVDPGGQHEANGGGGDVVLGTAALFNQGSQTRPPGAAEGL